MGVIWDDLKGMASDCWNGQNSDGDLAALGVDTASKIPGVKDLDILPSGKDAKGAVDGWEKDAGYQEHPGGGNLGTEIGTVAGGVLGGTAGAFMGPLGVGLGMKTGSEIGGWISNL
jgi:hypothetical protein